MTAHCAGEPVTSLCEHCDDIILKRSRFGIGVPEMQWGSNMPEMIVVSITAVICADIAYRAWLLSR